MSDWFTEFNSVFWITIGTMTFGFFAIVLKTALASKCDNLNLCYGCITVHRVVELEREQNITPINSITTIPPTTSNNDNHNVISSSIP